MSLPTASLRMTDTAASCLSALIGSVIATIAPFPVTFWRITLNSSRPARISTTADSPSRDRSSGKVPFDDRQIFIGYLRSALLPSRRPTLDGLRILRKSFLAILPGYRVLIIRSTSLGLHRPVCSWWVGIIYERYLGKLSRIVWILNAIACNMVFIKN